MGKVSEVHVSKIDNVKCVERWREGERAITLLHVGDNGIIGKINSKIGNVGKVGNVKCVEREQVQIQRGAQGAHAPPLPPLVLLNFKVL